MIDGHGLSLALWFFIGFAAVLLLINVMIDVGYGEVRGWFASLGTWCVKMISRGHERVATLRLR